MCEILPLRDMHVSESQYFEKTDCFKAEEFMRK